MEADGGPTASCGELLLVILLVRTGGALLPLPLMARAEALQAAFLEMPKACAFLAILELGSDPGLRPGYFESPCASRALARSLRAFLPATVPLSFEYGCAALH